MLYEIRFTRSPHRDGLRKWPANDAREVVQAQLAEATTGAIPEFFAWTCPMVWPDRYIIGARFLCPLPLDEVERAFARAIRNGLGGEVEIEAQLECFERLAMRN